MRHALALVALFALACGGDTYDAQGTNMAVGTDAEITVSDDSSGNHRVEIEVRHLAPPGRIAAGHTHFVAWSIPNGGVPQHIGTLDYDEDDRVGTLETLTPFDVFQVKITAERERLPRSPSEHVVVRQSVQHD